MVRQAGLRPLGAEVTSFRDFRTCRVPDRGFTLVPAPEGSRSPLKITADDLLIDVIDLVGDFPELARPITGQMIFGAPDPQPGTAVGTLVPGRFDRVLSRRRARIADDRTSEDGRFPVKALVNESELGAADRTVEMVEMVEGEHVVAACEGVTIAPAPGHTAVARHALRAALDAAPELATAEVTRYADGLRVVLEVNGEVPQCWMATLAVRVLAALRAYDEDAGPIDVSFIARRADS